VVPGFVHNDHGAPTRDRAGLLEDARGRLGRVTTIDLRTLILLKMDMLVQVHRDYSESDAFDTERCATHETIRPCRHCAVDHEVPGGFDPYCWNEYVNTANLLQENGAAEFLRLIDENGEKEMAEPTDQSCPEIIKEKVISCHPPVEPVGRNTAEMRPTSVMICGRRYEIFWVCTREELDPFPGSEERGVGSSNHEDLRIKIFTRVHMQIQRETLLHEIMHCVLSSAQVPIFNLLLGRDKSEMLNFEFEEYYIESLDAGVLSVLRENPEVTSWLLED